MRVTRDVREGFLKDTKQGRAPVRVFDAVASLVKERALDPGARLEFLRLPLDGGRESEVIEDAGPLALSRSAAPI
ncbi:MAG: hypothetical protein M0C28_31815 [Candidatus Moduliflexus flocculans]|nr:hypothetical protein [Candidatus Moduliflexus flocculans]